MKIKSVEAFPIALRGKAERAQYVDSGREPASPMARYAAYKGRRSSWMAGWPALGCVVTGEDGTFGFGLGQYSAPAASVIEGHFSKHLVGASCFATERHFDLMMRIASPYGGEGLASYAMSAVDLALWDLKGKLLDRPVYELAGGPQKTEICCYATGFDLEWYRELGFSAYKLPLSHGPEDGAPGLDDVERQIEAARKIVGDDADLMLDCWMALDVEHTVRLAKRLRPYNLRWIEDYLLPADLRGFREVRARLPWMGLATGEHWYLPTIFQEAAESHLVDILQPDLLWVGGFTATMRICNIADAYGLQVLPHGSMNWPYGQHLVLASSATTWGERSGGVSARNVPLADTVLLPGTAVIENGALVPSDAPGFGIEVDREWIDERRVQGTTSVTFSG